MWYLRVMSTKVHRQIYLITELEIGDRFYFADDRQKKVWEITADNACMHLSETKLFNQWSRQQVVYLRTVVYS